MPDGPGRGPDHPGGPPHGGGGPLSYPKALAILVVAVALGAYLLSLGTGHGLAASSTPTTPTVPPTSSTTTTAPATTPTTVAPSKAVAVLVANASHGTGVAGYYTTKLAAAGWGTLTPVNALTVATTSTVYFATGQQAAAGTVAAELGLPATDVQALSASVPVSSTTGAAVVVIAGADLASKVPPATTGAG